MKKYVCTACCYIYDPEQGDPDSGIKAGTPFEELPDQWVCPICGAPKSMFVEEGCAPLWQMSAGTSCCLK